MSSFPLRSVEHIDPSAYVAAPLEVGMPLTGKRRARRPFQRMFAVVLVAMVLPLLAVLALLIRLDSPGPAFFRQSRVGLGGRPFTVWKLRTMRKDSVYDGRDKEAGDA